MNTNAEREILWWFNAGSTTNLHSRISSYFRVLRVFRGQHSAPAFVSLRVHSQFHPRLFQTFNHEWTRMTTNAEGEILW